MEKIYLAVVEGVPAKKEWSCALKLAPDPDEIGRMKVDARNGKEAETFFKVIESNEGKTLIEAHPITGRTHQIRVHLKEAGHSIVGDSLYGTGDGKRAADLQFPIGLRSVVLSYFDPFTKRPVRIHA